MIVRDVLLAAGIGDVLGVLVPIVFFVIYLINQLISAKGKPQPQRGLGRRVPPQRPQAERAMRPPQPPGKAQVEEKPRGPAADLNDEIEKFLKRAGQRRGERTQREAPPRPSAGRKQPLRKPPAAPRRNLREEPVDVIPLDEPLRESIAASVDKHMGSGAFSQRAEHLADDVVRGERQMEQHLQTAFRHRVGTLASDSPQSSGPVTDAQTEVVTDLPSPAAALAQILRTPQGVREAVILSEVLARPEHRW